MPRATTAAFGQLLLEAEIRGMRINELVAALTLAIMKQDLFQLIGDQTKSPSPGL
jgi:hypothetical protein